MKHITRTQSRAWLAPMRACFAQILLHRCEDRLIKRTVAEVKSAVLTEQVCIEIDELGLREAA